MVTVLLTSSVNVWAKSEEGETLKFRFYNEEGKEINISKDMVALLLEQLERDVKNVKKVVYHYWHRVLIYLVIHMKVL